MSLVASQGGDTLEWYSGVPRSIRNHTILGLVLIVVVFCGFGAWAALAPLAAAVIAQGSFVATGNNKIVQHLEGGIIKAILVHEGDTVRVGDELVKLDETVAESNARQLSLRKIRLDAIIARLQAEARGQDQYDPPASVTEGLADPDIRAINDSQRENFRSARLKLDNQIQVLNENIAALQSQHAGSKGQLDSVNRQHALLIEERDAKLGLYKKGIISRPVVNAVERAIADSEGEGARLQSEADVALAQIARFNKQILQTEDDAKQAALDELQNAEAELDAIKEQMRGADNVLSRTAIKAPVSGVVVRLYYHTPGGVIESGKPIVEILPSDVPLVVEAQIQRTQIDEVHVGQMAGVRLTALNRRTTPMIEGKVIYVSADTVAGTTSNHDVYLARVSIAADQLNRAAQGFAPTPGMPAEILIETHERTFFEYLTKPIVDSMARAFREY